MLETSNEWNLGCVLISLDIVKAFDSISILALARFVVSLTDVPLRLKFALCKEILRPKFVAFVGLGLTTPFVQMFSGIRQGSPEASLLFAMFINYHLTLLTLSWDTRGLSFSLGKHLGLTALRAWIQEYIEAWNNESELINSVSGNLRIAVLAFVDDLVLASNPESQLL